MFWSQQNFVGSGFAWQDCLEDFFVFLGFDLFGPFYPDFGFLGFEVLVVFLGFGLVGFFVCHLVGVEVWQEHW